MFYLSLSYWLTKFVQEVANKNGGCYPPRSLYEIICGLKRHLEDVNEEHALNPLDSSDKRLVWSSCTLIQSALRVYKCRKFTKVMICDFLGLLFFADT